MIRSIITATGGYLPEKVLTNKDLEAFVDTSDEWITQRTGIRQRCIAAEGELTSDMAIKAARAALESGGYKSSDIDGVIIATSTPDQTFPAVAVKVQAALGIPPCLAFDMQAVCSGFVYALSVADSLIKTGQATRILLIGAEKFSSILDWNDRTTCVLFGDGAGAIILEKDERGAGTVQDRGVLSSHIYADGALKDILYVNGGVASTQDSGTIVMDGKEVFRNAVSYMSDIVNQVVKENNISADQIDWLVPHQANIRIIEAIAKKLNLPMDKVIVTVDKHGNTSAASIPLALDHAIKANQIKKDDLILFEALGAGLTWGAALVRF
jgi:3-oxoacyl-[acyl-carrier-protein] synthase-3